MPRGNRGARDGADAAGSGAGSSAPTGWARAGSGGGRGDLGAPRGGSRGASRNEALVRAPIATGAWLTRRVRCSRASRVCSGVGAGGASSGGRDGGVRTGDARSTRRQGCALAAGGVAAGRRSAAAGESAFPRWSTRSGGAASAAVRAYGRGATSRGVVRGRMAGSAGWGRGLWLRGGCLVGSTRGAPSRRKVGCVPAVRVTRRRRGRRGDVVDTVVGVKRID